MARSTPRYSTTELDFLIESIKRETDDTVLHRLDRMVFGGITHPVRQAYERDASLDYHFREGDHYTAEELAAYTERKQPPTKRNEIAPIIERITGQLIQTRQVATFLGRNTPSDDLIGQLSQDYMRFIDQVNLYEFEEQDMVDDALVGGVGWLKIEPRPNEMGQMQIVERARNPFNIVCDPYSTRYDPNEDGEAKFIAEGRWMDLEDSISLWPDKANELKQLTNGHGYSVESFTEVSAGLRNEAMAVYVDVKRHRLRPFEVWYKRKIKLYHLFLEDRIVPLPVPFDNQQANEIIRELGDGITKKPVYVDRMHVGVFVAGLLIHHDYSPHRTNLFPYVPMYFHRRKNGEPISLCRRLVPINEAINKRESKALSLLSNRQTLAEKNAVEDVERHQAEKAKPDGFMEVQEGALSNGKILIRDNIDLGQGQLSLLQEDKDAIRRVSGHGNESMGMPSEVRSGTGIARKQMMSNYIVLPTMNNLRRTRHLKAKLCFAYQQQYLTEEIAFQLTDDPNTPRTVTVSKGDIAAMKERIYDIVIVETKDWATVREQQTEMLLTALPQLAQHGSWMVKLGIQLSDLREKEGLLKMIDAQSQPAPAMPKMNIAMTWQDLTPEVQAYYALTAMQSPELAQAIMQQGNDPAFVKKLQASIVETQIKEGTRATIERGNVDLSAMQTAMEGMMRSREIFAAKQEAMDGTENPV
jgi:hypothetical protein